MLESIVIRDFALIEQLTINWTAGLNILTGETGAGKSILIDALNAVLGGKTSPSSIRSGCEKSSIEAFFTVSPVLSAWLKKQELLDTDSATLAVSRELTKSGSRSRINGILVNQSIVQELAQMVVTIHAQHEARTLLSAQSQLNMLDSLGNEEHQKLVDRVSNLVIKRKELLSIQKQLVSGEEERLRRFDFAQFQWQELASANLIEKNEDEELNAKHKILANVVQLEALINSTHALLKGSDSEEIASAVDLLQSSISEIEKALRIDDQLQAVASLLKSALASVEEAGTNLRQYTNKLDSDPQELAIIEARLATLAVIKRKYGSTIEEAIAHRQRLKEEIEQWENAEEKIAQVAGELKNVEEDLLNKGNQLSKRRIDLARHLSEKVLSELTDLGMERCKFEIQVNHSAEATSNGFDKVEFMISPNPGQPLFPLAKIASGGELARVMLAIKSIFASADQVATVVFDEIDTGLSGRFLQTVRDKLAQLAKSHQILCITHQPLIASVAGNHIEVRKSQSENETKVFAKSLSADERLKTLAAMASGEENEAVALSFARSLIDQAAELK